MAGFREAQGDLRLEFVTKTFGDFTAVDDLSLEVPRGSFFALLGPSGCGKTTTLRMVAGLEQPTSGRVLIGDTDLTGSRAYERPVNTVFQSYALFPHLTVRDNVAFGPRRRGVKDAHEQADDALRLVQMDHLAGRKPAQLSGGQQQRVGIARALATRPDILLCDEPTSALDAGTTRQILGLLRDLRDRLGITVVVITHEPSVVREVCDTVSLLADGRVVETGPIGAVVTDARGQLYRDLIPLPPLPLEHHGGYVEVALGDRRSGTTSVDGVLALLRDGGVSVEVTAATLETIGGQRVGRIQLEVDPARTDEAVRLLEAAHLSPEVAA